MNEVLQFRPNRKVMVLKCILAPLFSLIPALGAGIPLFYWTQSLTSVLVGVIIVMLAIGAIRILYVVHHFDTVRYEISEQTVINEEGLFWKVRRTTPVDKITNVDVRQGPLERWLGVGQVWVFTPSTGALTPEAMLTGVDNPHDIRARILALSEKARSTPGTAAQRGGEAKAAAAASDPVLHEILGALKSIEALLKGGAKR